MNRKHILHCKSINQTGVFLEMGCLAILVKLRNSAKITILFKNMGVPMYFFGHCENGEIQEMDADLVL